MAIDRTGISQTPTGWQVYVRVRPLTPVKRRFKRDTKLATLIEERDKIRAALRLRRNDDRRLAPTAGTFAADAARYLEAVAGMPTIADRRWQIQKWVDRFGPRHRHSITSADIRTALAEWQHEGYSARTRNHFRGALMHLWTVLDTRSAVNPVRDVPAARLPDDLPRNLPPAAVADILGRIAPSKARAVLRLMAATGMTPTEISRVEPGDILRDALIARGRRKGKGTRPRTLPLTADALDALLEFRTHEAWGGVSLKTIGAAWRRAKQKAGYGHTDWKAYDLRHTVLTEYATAGDDRVVQYLGGHSTAKMTQRYTLGSVPDRVAAVVASVVAKRRDGQTERETNRAISPVTAATTETTTSSENEPVS